MNSEPELTKLRQPRAISGAFASVFPLTNKVTGTCYAVKCFTRYVPDQQDRYRAISEKLAALPSADLSQPWKIGFEYLPDAVLVGRHRYPILKMEWVRGVTLSAWLDAHHRDSIGVDRLAEHFAGLIADLSDHGIAHGDLQHGNLLVTDDGTLRLLDYDGMYVPALGGLGGTERGHRNYQSPARGNHDFGSDLDRFSAWVIYLALKAIAVDSALWPQLHEPQGEYLLLAEDDFTNPAISQRFPTLLTHPDRGIRDLAEQVRFLASQPLAVLPELAARTVGTTSAPPVSPAGPATNRLPGWMAGHVAAGPPSRSASTSKPDTLPRFNGRRSVDVLTMLLVLMTTVIAISAFVFPSPAVALVPLAGAWAVVWTARRSRTETIALRRHLRELRQRHAETADIAKAEAAVRDEQAQLDLTEQQRLAQLPARRNQLQAQYNRDLAAAETRMRSRITTIERERADLERKLQSRMINALETERADHIRQALTRSLISNASITGIGTALTRDLAAQGIRTAADFSGISLSAPGGTYNSVTAYIVTPNGRKYVRGIGEVKANALDAWRRSLATRAGARFTRTAPSSAGMIRAQYDRDISGLTQKTSAAENEAKSHREQAKQKYEAAVTQLSAEATAATAAATHKRQEFGRRLAALRNAPAELASIEQQIAAAREHRKHLSHVRYVRFTLTGR
ncbi:hypothetical protein JK358_32125 [Nocardia sp. 2]|uniref:Protein kinase domain-containing protein n=1 Tax=Nocardia acididurans TaxID=2802282 RepID=A0ABS1MET7_9NOCA|nr:AarF/UbiB family protein [Nocardia acididurans]MBL1079061.1 hypothetical protein [Nocardia acididurans]